jgi:hypothetical protein
LSANVIEVAAGVNPGAAGTTYTLTLTSSIAVGDLIVVEAEGDTTDALSNGSITDSADGTTFGTHTYTLAAQASENSAHRHGLWYVVCATAMTAGVSKVKFTTGGSSHKAIIVKKLAGSNTISLDKTASSANQTTTTNPVTGTTAATTQAVEVLFASFLYANAPTFTAPGGWTQTATTQQTTSTGSISMSTVHKFVSSTGTQSATATLGTTETAGGLIATFKYTDSGASPPANTGAPVVSGNTWQGQVLTSTAGTWTDDGSGVKTYQWQRDTAGNGSFTNISSATASTYTTVGADLGNKVRCVVTDTDGIGATSANSNQVGLISPSYAPSLNAGKVDVCANTSLPVYTPGFQTYSPTLNAAKLDVRGTPALTPVLTLNLLPGPITDNGYQPKFPQARQRPYHYFQLPADPVEASAEGQVIADGPGAVFSRSKP